jgi:hypothetical protein
MKRVVWLALSLVAVVLVQAHELSVHWEIRGEQLIIKADSDGEAAAGAAVEVRSAEGELLSAGELDESGAWQGTISDSGDLTVVVDAGFGHRRSVNLTAEQLHPEFAASVAREGVSAHRDEAAHEHGEPEAQGSSDAAQSVGLRVMVGLTFVLALSAAWLSFRNMRRLDALARR